MNVIKYVYWFLLKLVGITPEKKNRRFHQKRQKSIIDQYLAQHSIRKLQIGAQSNSVQGWLNVDIEPKTHSVCYMDATKKFPFAGEQFDYVFAEHMIEHIQFEESAFMVKEINRILRPGGKVRIATPNLVSLASVCLDPQKPEHAAYIGQYHARFFPGLPFDPVFVVNKLFYSFHHKFIHSYSTLEYILKQAGFVNVRPCQVGVSDDTNLCDLEQHWREIGKIPNIVETIVVEAEKGV